jgi:hypothetical protein
VSLQHASVGDQLALQICIVGKVYSLCADDLLCFATVYDDTLAVTVGAPCRSGFKHALPQDSLLDTLLVECADELAHLPTSRVLETLYNVRSVQTEREQAQADPIRASQVVIFNVDGKTVARGSACMCGRTAEHFFSNQVYCRTNYYQWG